MTGDANAPMVTLDRKLWLTADRENVVEDGDVNAAFLLGGEGDEIPEDEADRLGLKKRSKKPSEDKKAETPEDKQADAPANKSRKTS